MQRQEFRVNRGRPHPRRHRAAEVELKRLVSSSSLLAVTSVELLRLQLLEEKKKHVQTSSVDVAICAPLSFHRRRVTAGKPSEPSLLPERLTKCWLLWTILPNCLLYVFVFIFLLCALPCVSSVRALVGRVVAYRR